MWSIGDAVLAVASDFRSEERLTEETVWWRERPRPVSGGGFRGELVVDDAAENEEERVGDGASCSLSGRFRRGGGGGGGAG
jgi:hypothetical protein